MAAAQLSWVLKHLLTLRADRPGVHDTDGSLPKFWRVKSSRRRETEIFELTFTSPQSSALLLSAGGVSCVGSPDGTAAWEGPCDGSRPSGSGPGRFDATELALSAAASADSFSAAAAAAAAFAAVAKRGERRRGTGDPAAATRVFVDLAIVPRSNEVSWLPASSADTSASRIVNKAIEWHSLPGS